MKDIFGRELLDYYEGNYTRKSFLIRDDGEKSTIPIDVYFKDYSDWDNLNRWLMGFVRGRVLDIGAGAGRHSLYLQKKHDVLAMDISEGALRVMRKRGVKNLCKMDINQLNFPKGSFDTVLLMFNNFGLAGDVEKTRIMLSRLFRITSPKGRIITTIRNPYKTTNKEHLLYHKRNQQKGKLSGLVTLKQKYNGQEGDWFDLLMVSPKELREVLKGTGWKVRFDWVFENSPFYGVVIEKRLF
jgi:ubiquinone/menaquinone biosynthesis C-methylase UbiE